MYHEETDKNSENNAISPSGLLVKVLEKPSHPLIKGKQIASNKVGETCAPSMPKQINNQEDHMVREIYDNDQYFKFMSKTLENQ